MKKKVLITILVIFILFVASSLTMFIIYSTAHKLVCTSNTANITLIYNNKKIIGYKSVGELSFNMKNQNSYIEKIGITEYINNFKVWFSNNTSGNCK